jgi:hypothetical protein
MASWVIIRRHDTWKVMKSAIETEPWFQPCFLIVWFTAMAYVTIYLSMVVRYRKLTGLSQGRFDVVTVFFDPATRQYFWWMFTGKHHELNSASFSRLVYTVRASFVIAAILMMLFITMMFSRHFWR